MTIKILKGKTAKVKFGAGITVPKVSNQAALDKKARDIKNKTEAFAKKIKV